MLTVDGVPKRIKQRRIWREITRRRRPLQLLRDLYEVWRAVR
jgi:electron transfer flavoprotein-quinone oxidoreductase